MKDDKIINHTATSDSIQFHYLKIIKWLIIGWIVSIIAVVSIFTVLWLQYDYVGTDTTQSEVMIDGTNGVANYIGNDGDILNGENNSKNNEDKNESSP